MEPYELSDANKLNMAKELFPFTLDDPIPGKMRCDPPPPFSHEELILATSRLRTKRAPGPDGILAESIKAAVEHIPTLILGMMNSILQEQRVPITWKKANLILIPKGEARSQEEQKHRPLCLLDVMGKLFEILIRGRLLEEAQEKQGLSGMQFSFTKGKSTVHAVERVVKLATCDGWTWGVVLLIDVKNAFNTAKWSKIIGVLNRLGISQYLINLIADYFRNRSLMIGKEAFEVYQGVPQGSILGPLLWNLLYNGVLEIDLPNACSTVAYADDLALIVRTQEREDLIGKSEEALEAIRYWLGKQGLEVAPQKTECIILKGPRKRTGIGFQMGHTRILPSRHCKYLGVSIDDRRVFNEHVKKTCAKAARQVSALG